MTWLTMCIIGGGIGFLCASIVIVNFKLLRICELLTQINDKVKDPEMPKIRFEPNQAPEDGPEDIPEEYLDQPAGGMLFRVPEYATESEDATETSGA